MRPLVFVLGSLWGFILAAPVGAAPLSLGGGWEPQASTDPLSATPSPSSFAQFQFTPRQGRLGSIGVKFDVALGAQDMGEETTSYLDGVFDLDRHKALGLTPTERRPSGAANPSVSWLGGGALEWRGVTLSGAFGQTAVSRFDSSTVSAGLAYGDWRANLVYTQIERQAETRDIYMLSTDVAAKPWMRLGGDVALSSDERESAATGRISLRLSF